MSLVLRKNREIVELIRYNVENGTVLGDFGNEVRGLST